MIFWRIFLHQGLMKWVIFVVLDNILVLAKVNWLFWDCW